MPKPPPPPPPRRRAAPIQPIGLGIPRSKRSPGSAAVALLAHILLFFIIIRAAAHRDLDFQASAGDPGELGTGGGGGGGGSIRMIALPAFEVARPVPPPVVPPPPPPVPVPVPPPVVVKPDPIVPPAPPTPPDSVVAGADPAQPSGSGTGTGTGTGKGTGTGSGSGSGSGTGSGRGSGNGPGSGEGGSARAPEPRQLILPPPDIPKALRGATIAVTFMIDPEGRVVDVRFSPEPDDHGFGTKLEAVMRSYKFRPARGPDGLPVAGTFAVQLTF